VFSGRSLRQETSTELKRPLLDLSAGAASRARQKLLNGGDLVDTTSGLNVVDPLLSDWLRQRFRL
jgi:hypothetical protein